MGALVSTTDNLKWQAESGQLDTPCSQVQANQIVRGSSWAGGQWGGPIYTSKQLQGISLAHPVVGLEKKRLGHGGGTNLMSPWSMLQSLYALGI